LIETQGAFAFHQTGLALSPTTKILLSLRTPRWWGG
jgi:hypothetical protein